MYTPRTDGGRTPPNRKTQIEATGPLSNNECTVLFSHPVKV